MPTPSILDTTSRWDDFFMTIDEKYPVHEKLHKIKDQSQAVHEFLNWCSESGRDIHLAEWVNDGSWMLPTQRDLKTLLAEFFGIDLRALEDEKRQMLEDLRKLS